jgi:hypothetical protein
MASSGPTECDELLEQQSSKKSSTLAKPLAPEEIRCGDYVTPLEEIAEWPSFFWCDELYQQSREQPIRIRMRPSWGGVPLRVVQVCLPFVLVKQPCGSGRTLDVRKVRIARLAKRYARAAWKSFKKSGQVANRSC